MNHKAIRVTRVRLLHLVVLVAIAVTGSAGPATAQTHSVSVTPQGLRLEERLGNGKRLVQVNVQTEAELYEWAGKFLQRDLQNGWERMPDERHD